MGFKVEDKVFETLGDVCFGVVITRGVDNARHYPEIDALLARGVSGAEEMFSHAKVKEHPAITPYRDAFAKLNMNPNKFMSSIEALFTRVSKGKGMPSINPVVDMGNAVSLKYVLPIGAHDIDQMDGDIEVRFSREGDGFIPFGEKEGEQVPPGELVYVVGEAVRTRRWIWRQSEIGKIEADCRNVFYPIDGFGVNRAEVLAARDELAALCERIFGAAVSVDLVDADHRNLNF